MSIVIHGSFAAAERLGDQPRENVPQRCENDGGTYPSCRNGGGVLAGPAAVFWALTQWSRQALRGGGSAARSRSAARAATGASTNSPSGILRAP